MADSASPACSVCAKSGGEMHQCSGCKAKYYCGRECQTADWKAHKKACAAAPKWYDKHRLCQDGTTHEGRLELITWNCPEKGLGWGACFADESDDLKTKFKLKFGGDEAKFFDYWPQGFRWTCCGTDAGMSYGCDHHGSGSRPCTCDFCKMGKPLPNGIFNEKNPFEARVDPQTRP
ncbi:hypothetical protein MSAN_00059600 [Mycena sanguinolenta]|uniref:MYND-type domain-containing protein n=1 Tax=Mycena sanguinolenta TaxID=230812 RepID=A0A8H6ZCC1_9AGAR|nr:hypothetical protein MSAN_00059600 [Mycena sanguinolenta]